MRAEVTRVLEDYKRDFIEWFRQELRQFCKKHDVDYDTALDLKWILNELEKASIEENLCEKLKKLLTVEREELPATTLIRSILYEQIFNPKDEIETLSQIGGLLRLLEPSATVAQPPEPEPDDLPF